MRDETRENINCLASWALTKEKDSDFSSVIKQLSLSHRAADLPWLAVFEVAAVPIMLLQFFLQQIFALAEDTEGEKGTTKEKTKTAKTTFIILERIFIFSEYSHAESNVNSSRKKA